MMIWPIFLYGTKYWGCGIMAKMNGARAVTRLDGICILVIRKRQRCDKIDSNREENKKWHNS